MPKEQTIVEVKKMIRLMSWAIVGELLCIAELMQQEGTSNNREREEANSGKELEMMCSERVEE